MASVIWSASGNQTLGRENPTVTHRYDYCEFSFIPKLELSRPHEFYLNYSPKKILKHKIAGLLV